MLRFRGYGLIAFMMLATGFCRAETWHPFPMDWDKSPINLSFLLDPPAGKHGFLGVKGDRFVFEDGTEIRFWGTTLTGSGCFPSQDMAPVIAERLYRFGINLVRFHQLDAEWAEPNLFVQSPSSRELLNSETLDRLDYFLYQLETRGIYAWFDGLSSRRLRESDGIPSWNYLPPGLKGYIYFVPELQRIHHDFLQAFWSHRNRYNSRQYRDSPSIALTELFHDSNLLLDRPRIQPFADQFRDLWKTYLIEQGGDPELSFQWDAPSGEMRRFLSTMVHSALQKVFSDLRGFSVKTPITSTNTVISIDDLPTISDLDFIHAEALWNPPGLPVQMYSNRKMIDIDPSREGNLFSRLAFSRVEKKPFIVSQWGEPWPCEYRAELPIWIAALAGFQNWQGCISSTYRSFHDPDIYFITDPLEAFNDPCYFGLMPAAALLFHRGGMKPAGKTASIVIPETLLFSQDLVTPADCVPSRLVDSMNVVVKLKSRASGKNIFSPTQTDDLLLYLRTSESKAKYRRDRERGLVLIDTPGAQAFIGRIDQARWGDLSYVDLQSDEEFAVVCVNSLDNRPIHQSKDMWVTVVSQARNQGFQAENLGQESYRIENVGHAPVMLRETPVRLFLTTSHRNWTIAMVDGNGNSGETLPYQIDEGRLSFRAGIHGTLYYRLQCP